MKPHGEQVYEERVTLWRTDDLDPQSAQAYLLADATEDGAEVFSLMRTSDLDPDAYIDQFFDTGNERQRWSG